MEAVPRRPATALHAPTTLQVPVVGIVVFVWERENAILAMVRGITIVPQQRHAYVQTAKATITGNAHLAVEQERKSNGIKRF